MPASSDLLPSLPFLRFHLKVGGRIAMLALLPAVVAVVAGVYILGPDYLDSLAVLLFGAGSRGGSGLVIALTLFGAASLASPRICRGLLGWIRHLPAAALAERRAAVLAVAVAQTPLLVLLLGLAFAAAKGNPRGLPLDALGLAVAATGAALAALPVARGWIARPLALAAAVAAPAGGWGTLGVALALLAAADLTAGRLVAAPMRRTADTVGTPFAFFARIALRALGWRLASAWGVGLLPLAAAGFFLANNAGLPIASHHLAMAGRLGALAALVLFCSALAESLAVQRPVWPWLRSLPLSSGRRALFDTLLLGLAAFPLVALATVISLGVALTALLFLPALAVRAAGAVRRAPERRTGASGEILAEGMLAAGAVALLPALAVAGLAAAPFLLRLAAARDRAQKVSRWLPIHHLAAGDSQSWSPS